MSGIMPVVFVGHGSPMNAVEENQFSAGWRQMAAALPRPGAILAVSAHWYAGGTLLCADPRPKTVYDMYGFPPELYQATYPAPGSPALAADAAALLGEGAQAVSGWGLDHGVWSVLRRMYPAADIPVVPMSVDAGASAGRWFELGRSLRPLRRRGVLILASGNVVHNLGLLDWNRAGGFDWADEFDAWARENILAGRREALCRWQEAGPCAQKAVPTPDHYAPLLYAAGAAEEDDRPTVWNDARTLGSLSMTSYIFAK